MQIQNYLEVPSHSARVAVIKKTNGNKNVEEEESVFMHSWWECELVSKL